MKRRSLALFVLSCAVRLAWSWSSVFEDAQQYHLQEAYIGEEFFRSWSWETFQDPTHGRVNYIDQSTAISKNLSYVLDGKFVIRADFSTHVAPSSRGRDSVRIKSKAAFSDSLMVLDLSHIPEGCATWPAWWTLSRAGPWPIGGEIDIIEGVNLNAQNAATLHTSPDCSMPESRNQNGKASSSNCNVAENSNQGCGTTFSKPNSYGSDFNREKGGWYIVQRSRYAINIWFWSREDPSLPSSIKYGTPDLEIGQDWGIPEASFPYDNCDYASHFDAHQILFDLTFCGDWAGSTFGISGCGTGPCDQYVDQNPEAFENAFWEINSLRIYTPSYAMEHFSVPQESQHPVLILVFLLLRTMDGASLLQPTVDKLRPDLSLPETEDSWERIARAITALKAALEVGGYANLGEVVQTIRSFQSPITQAMNSERTRLCSPALDLVDTVATICEADFEPLLAPFFPVLLTLCGRTNKVVINRTRLCVIHIVENTRLTSVLPHFLQHLREKSPTLRLIAVEGTLACVKCCNPPDLEKEIRATDIESIIRKAARDANADVRRAGRELFGAYKLLLPHRVDKFTAPLTPTIRKYLDVKAGDGSKRQGISTVKYLTSLSTVQVTASKPPLKHTRAVSVSIMKGRDTQPSIGAKRPEKPSTSTAVVPSIRPQPLIKPTETKTEPPKKFISSLSQAGLVGPSRIISSLDCPGAARPPGARPQRTMPPPPPRPLSRPVVASANAQSTIISGPRRVPLPSTNQSHAQPERLPMSRPNSQQGRHVSNTKSTSETTSTVPKPNRIIRPPTVKPIPTLAATVGPERRPRVHHGLTQPTASQLAKVKSAIIPKSRIISDPKKVNSGTSLPRKGAAGKRPASPLCDGAPRNNAMGPDVPLASSSSVSGPEPLQEAAEVALLPLESNAEEPTVDSPCPDPVAEGSAEIVPSPPPPVESDLDACSQTITGEPAVEITGKGIAPFPNVGTNIVLFCPDEQAPLESNPTTPPNYHQQGLGWNINDAKTPISALLTSIQQGFEFSPSSPLSPPQGYLHANPTPALTFGQLI